MKSINELKNLDFKVDGLEIHDVFSQEQLNNLTVDFYNRILMQAYKINAVDSFDYKNYGEEVNIKKLDEYVIEVNEKNKRSLDFASGELRECPAFNALISENFVKVCSKLLNCPGSLLKVHIDGFFINIPSSTQLLYKFHSEKHYYPYRRNFLNFWMPVIRDKTEENGAMVVKHMGHTKSYQFNEYSGFNKVEGLAVNEDVFKYQLEIPSADLNQFESVVTDLKVGQALFFDANMPHTSQVNTSNDVSYSLVIRVYDFRRDLTLSDNTGIKSYQGSGGGYPDIRPIYEE